MDQRNGDEGQGIHHDYTIAIRGDCGHSIQACTPVLEVRAMEIRNVTSQLSSESV